GQMPASARGQLIEPCLAAGVADAPFGPDPFLLLQPVQRRIQRTLLHPQHLLRDLPQPLCDAVAVARPQRKDLEDQEVERAWQQLWRHRQIVYLLAREVKWAPPSFRHDAGLGLA